MDSMFHKFSVILSSFNRPVMIKEAINSIWNQDYVGRIELIIMDDNSNSETINNIKSKLAVNGFDIDYNLSINIEKGSCYTGNNSLRPNMFVKFFISNVEDQDRKDKCRYAYLINLALTYLVTGDVVCYLTDDSVYRHNKFSILNEIFQDTKINATYDEMVMYDVKIFNNCVIRKSTYKPFNSDVGKAIPYKKERLFAENYIDHITLSHRYNCVSPVTEKYKSIWDDNKSAWIHSDWIFWKRLAEFYEFIPVPVLLSEKWMHDKCVQKMCNSGGLTQNINREELRE